MFRTHLVVAIFIGLVCAHGRAALAQPTSQSSGTSHKAGASKQEKRIILDRVVAVVQDAIILQSELETRVGPFSAELETITDPRERARRTSKLTSQMLEDMISEELIVQAAREAKLAVEPKEISAAVQEIKQQNKLDDAGLEQALAMQGYTLESYKEDVRRQILRMRAVNMMVRPKVTVTDDDVRARYDEMNRRSSAVSNVHLKHVLIELPQRPSEQQLAAARARAAEIIEKVKAGESFDTLAQQYSDDAATKMGGGDLGWIERGSLPTEWESVVFSMDKGDVRGPIGGPSGLHVFYVEEVKQSDLKPFDELKDQLRNELYRKEMDKQTGLWLDEMRKKAHIERKL